MGEGQPSLPAHYGTGGLGQPGQHHHHTSVEPRQHRQWGGRGRRARVGVQEIVKGLESEGMEPEKLELGSRRWSRASNQRVWSPRWSRASNQRVSSMLIFGTNL
jgi:hypothetical protein